MGTSGLNHQPLEVMEGEEVVRKQTLTPVIPSKNDTSQNVSFIFSNRHFDHGIPYLETSMTCPVSLGEVYTNV